MAVVLIIDDSPTELHLFQNMLEKGGFDTLGCRQRRGGHQGRPAKSRPDCILMDVVMPGMNGFQATRKLTQDPKTSVSRSSSSRPRIRRPTRSGACGRAPWNTSSNRSPTKTSSRRSTR